MTKCTNDKCQFKAKCKRFNLVSKDSFVFLPHALLTDDEIEEYIWENISVSLCQIDIDTQSDGYIKYLNAVHWAKWGRDNCNGL